MDLTLSMEAMKRLVKTLKKVQLPIRLLRLSLPTWLAVYILTLKVTGSTRSSIIF